jgi:alpha-tubulin suppressor-like RCC1 family protein
MPTGVTFTSLSVNKFVSCALDSIGKAYCWGRHDNVNNTLTPTWVNNYNLLASSATTVYYASLQAGEFHNCGLSASGQAYCWGKNQDGQLGDGTTTDSTQPVAVTMPAGISFTAIALGGKHACAIGVNASAAKSIWCWGAAGIGQLGYGTYTGTPFETSPRQVQLSHITNLGFNIQNIDAGKFHTCAIFQAEGTYCWGDNSDGQLGAILAGPPQSDIPVAVAVPAGVSFRQTASGNQHTCAVSTSDDAYCWGYNGFGRLGDNTTTNRLTPVKVVQP